MTRKEVEERPDVVEAIELLGAIRVSDREGFSIRGARPGQTSIRVDGMDVGDPVLGAFGPMGAELFPLPGVSAIDSLTVRPHVDDSRIVSPFPGIIDITLRRGSRERIGGEVRFTTDLGALGGWSDPITTRLAGTAHDTVLPSAKGMSRGRRDYEISVGGPIPVAGAATFFLAGRLTTFEHLGASYEVYDMSADYARQRDSVARALWGASLSPTNLGQLPHQSAMVRDLSGVLRWELGESSALEIEGEYGATSSEVVGPELAAWDMPAAWSALYMSDRSTVNGVLERDAQQANANLLTSRIAAGYQLALGQTSQVSLGVAYRSMNYQVGKKDESRSYGPFSTYDLVSFDDDRNHDGIVEAYTIGPDPTNPFPPNITHAPRLNSQTGFYEGGLVAGASRNPFGIVGTLFPAHGNLSWLEERQASLFSAHGEYSAAFRTEHAIFQIDVGARYDRYTLRHDVNYTPWAGPRLYDLYGYDFGAPYPGIDTMNIPEYLALPHEPSIIGAFFQGTYTTGLVTLRGGVRYESFDPDVPDRPKRVTPDLLDSLNATAPKIMLSPRIGFDLRSGRRSSLYGSVAVEYALPELYYLNDNLFGSSYTQQADPDLAPGRSLSVELGWRGAFGDAYEFDATGFHRSLSDLLQEGADGNSYLSVGTGLVLGVDIALTRRLLDHFGFSFRYGLLYAYATTGDIIWIDPSQPNRAHQHPVDSTALYPTSSDRAHTLTATFNAGWGAGEGPMIFGVHALEQFAARFDFLVGTGLPYTQIRENGVLVSSYNGNRFGDRVESRLYLERTLRLSDWLGSGAGNLELTLFLNCDNLFNVTHAIAVRLAPASPSPGGSRTSLTGDPNVDSLLTSTSVDDFPQTPLYRDVDASRPETFAAAQYDAFGARLYNPYADGDGDGVETQQEKFAGYQRFVAAYESLRSTYQQPRSFSIGVKLRF